MFQPDTSAADSLSVVLYYGLAMGVVWCGVVDGEKLVLQIYIHLGYPVSRIDIYSNSVCHVSSRILMRKGGYIFRSVGKTRMDFLMSLGLLIYITVDNSLSSPPIVHIGRLSKTNNMYNHPYHCSSIYSE